VIPYQPKKCNVCERALTVHQLVRGGICDDARCRAHTMRFVVARRRADEQAAMHKVATQWLSSTLSQRSPSLDIALVVLRGRDASLEPVPEAQRASLIEHVVAMTNEAAELDGDALQTAVAELPSTAEPNTTLGVACATCSGFCCRTGGSRAYIDARTIARVRSQQPQLDNEAVLALYSNSIPAEHVVDSCVFHGGKGCTLPRAVRAEICNVFYCEPIKAWWVTRQSESVAIAVVQDSQVVRSALIAD